MFEIADGFWFSNYIGKWKHIILYINKAACSSLLLLTVVFSSFKLHFEMLLHTEFKIYNSPLVKAAFEFN